MICWWDWIFQSYCCCSSYSFYFPMKVCTFRFVSLQSKCTRQTHMVETYRDRLCVCVCVWCTITNQYTSHIHAYMAQIHTHAHTYDQSLFKVRRELGAGNFMIDNFDKIFYFISWWFPAYNFILFGSFISVLNFVVFKFLVVGRGLMCVFMQKKKYFNFDFFRLI